MAVSDSKVLVIKVLSTLIVFVFICDPFIEIGEKSLFGGYRECSFELLFDVDLEVFHPAPG